jgi:hypothetical protein
VDPRETEKGPDVRASEEDEHEFSEGAIKIKKQIKITPGMQPV